MPSAMELPPLPKTRFWWDFRYWREADGPNDAHAEAMFDADQMRAYALSAIAAHEAARPSDDETQQQLGSVAWAVERWYAEVSNRPLVNIHRRTLDDTWRQVIRHFGGDPVALLGPAHDDLLIQQRDSK